MKRGNAALAEVPGAAPAGAAKLLLFGVVGGHDARLRRTLAETRAVQLRDAGPPVRVALAAAVALTRAGDRAGRAALTRSIDTGDAADLQ